MSTRDHQSRPRLCSDRLVDGYLARAQDGDDLRVLKTVRAVESLIVNAGIIGITALSIHYGEANPYVVLAAIATLGLLNGVLAADYRALARALAELSSPPEDDAEAGANVAETPDTDPREDEN